MPAKVPSLEGEMDTEAHCANLQTATLGLQQPRAEHGKMCYWQWATLSVFSWAVPGPSQRAQAAGGWGGSPGTLWALCLRLLKMTEAPHSWSLWATGMKQARGTHAQGTERSEGDGGQKGTRLTVTPRAFSSAHGLRRWLLESFLSLVPSKGKQHHEQHM